MVKITLHDFLNYSIEGLSDLEIRKIQQSTGIKEKGCFMMASYKAGIWDGKSSFINEDGVGLIRNLPDVLDVMEGQLRIDMDNIEVEDKRSNKLLKLPAIDSEWLKKETGYSLYDYQEEGINKAIGLTHCESGIGGILKLATNAGKSVLAMGISKAFDGKLKTLVIVPSTNLVEQTFKDYLKSDMRTAILTSKLTKKQRIETINNYNHIIMTNSLFLNLHEQFQKDEWVLIYDEVHEFGEKTSMAIRESLGHCQYRIGLTATMPEEKKDHYKDAFIRHHFGDNLVVIDQKELIDRGISSAMTIRCINIGTPIDTMSAIDKSWDWDKEMRYYNTNAIRFEAIVEQIKEERGGNTLILCQPTLGAALGEEFEINFVDEAIPTDVRGKWYSEFDKSDEYLLAASYGCASTGLSINNIQTLILIEVGKDRTRIMQSIGRGLRLDGDTNFINVVDISSNTKYAVSHRKERHKIYSDEGFNFEVVKEIYAQ